MARRILVTGASIAGTTLAWWLDRYGFEVTVVERHPAFRDGGQNVDIRGAGHDVLRRMGLERAVAASGTGETGIRFVDEDNETVAEFDVDEMGEDGPTAELEILRGDLARLLYDHCRDRVTFRFGDSIAAVTQAAEAVEVRFASGETGTYEAVVVAEGAGSTTRELLFPGENDPRFLDVTMAYFTIPHASTDDDHCRIFTAGEGRGIWLRPDNHGTTRAILVVQKDPEGEDQLSPDEQKAWLADHFADAGWEAPRVLAGLETTEDLYFDVLRQVRMERWSNGRVILTGDAAWCATPIAGIGTTLAMVGAYVLAGELSLAVDPATAARNYEEILRPFVKDGQDVPKSGPKFLQPQTRLGVVLQHAVLRMAALPGIKQAVGSFFASDDDEMTLPNYPLP